MDQDFISNYIALKDGTIKNRSTGKIIKPYKMKNGYLQVTLYNFMGKHKKFLVHRLVALQHIPNPYNLPQINHKDCNKTNNSVDNLEWCSAKYNLRYARANGKNIYTEERNRKISNTKMGAPRSKETKEKLSLYMKNLSQEKKMAMTHHLHKNRPSKTCPFCLVNNQDLPRVNH